MSRRFTPITIAVVVICASSTLAQQAPFTVVVLPDTQYYTQSDVNNDTYFKGQTNWIVANRQALNIQFMMHLGDIQNNGNPYYANGQPTPWLNGDESQWIRADASLDILDAAGMPYSLVPGNHDYLRHDMKIEPGYFLKWFGPTRFAGKPTYGGSSVTTPTSPAGMNSWHHFTAGGYRFLNIALQYAPDTHDLAWAQDVINRNPGVPTIVTTHSMLKLGGYDSDSGVRRNIFDNFAKNNPQVMLMMNGHRNGEYRQIDTNVAGGPVHQLLVDFQNIAFPGYFQGGGYLRTMQFDTQANRINVKTYSPVIGNFQTDADSQFTLKVDFARRFGLPNGGGTTGTVSFRNGANNYAGTKDTYLSAIAPTTNYGETAYSWADGDEDTGISGAQFAQGLLRFDGVFGDAPGTTIPAGAMIDAATLTLHTSVASNAQTNSVMRLFRLLQPWEENSTFNSMIAGITADGLEAILAANGTVSPTAQGSLMTFDVTESLAAWAQGAPNYGWVVLPGGTDGWRYDTSEAAALTNRPLLEVSFRFDPDRFPEWTTVPEPAGAGALVLAVVFGRRRRATGSRLPR